MAQSSTLDLGLAGVDDLYFSALFDDEVKDEVFSTFDDKYAHELQIQETLIASVITSQSGTNRSVSASAPPLKAAVEDLKTEQIEYFTTEVGESSSQSQIICEICAEAKGNDQMFKSQRCDHSFCSECITKQVATKIQESISIVPCPGLDCKGVIEIDACRPMLPKDLVERWDEVLCEALFLAAPKFYCPFKDCSAMMLLDENSEGGEGGILIRESECPACHRLFCARCSVPWHPGVECEEFQGMDEDQRGRDDLRVIELAKEKKWIRCPKCKYYVEKTEGCLHINCRCHFEFCYGCGEKWTSTHGGCQRNE